MTKRNPAKPEGWPAKDRGVYCLVLRLGRTLRVKPGRLGEARLEPGFLLYVGRARRNLFARLARHVRRDKPRRWHVDYLFPAVRPMGAFVSFGLGPRECELASRLERQPGIRKIVKGFGASDCRCSGHLLRTSGKQACGTASGPMLPSAITGSFEGKGWTFFPASELYRGARRVGS